MHLFGRCFLRIHYLFCCAILAQKEFIALEQRDTLPWAITVDARNAISGTPPFSRPCTQNAPTDAAGTATEARAALTGHRRAVYKMSCQQWAASDKIRSNCVWLRTSKTKGNGKGRGKGGKGRKKGEGKEERGKGSAKEGFATVNYWDRPPPPLCNSQWQTAALTRSFVLTRSHVYIDVIEYLLFAVK